MLQVAETFEMQMEDDATSLKDIARLDTCVTVVDAASFMQHLQSVETLKVSTYLFFLPQSTPCPHPSGGRRPAHTVITQPCGYVAAISAHSSTDSKLAVRQADGLAGTCRCHASFPHA